MTARVPYDESEITRLYHLSNVSWDQQARNLKQFGLRDGMSVLEIGSGPGFITEKLSELIPNGSITCIDVDELLMEHANDYLKQKARCQYRILEMDVMQMDFPDNSFDFAVARQVVQYMPDTLGFAKSVFRVLKPGGKLVMTEYDADLGPTTDPSFPEVRPVLDKARQAQMAVGANPTIGRQMWRLLKAAGYKNLDLEAIVYHSGKVGLETVYPQFDPDRVAGLVQAGFLTEAELQAYRDVVKKFLESEDPFFLTIWLMACGEKP